MKEPRKNIPAGRAAPKKKILVADDFPLTRVGLVETLNREPDFVVCAEAGTARETMKAIVCQQPDLVLLDLTLPDQEGLELVKDIHVLHPGLPVLVVSMREETFYAPRVLRAGGRGYVMKSEGPEKVVAAARTVLAGQIALSKTMAARALESFSGSAGKSVAAPEEALSDRELEVLALSGQGWSTEEIAEQLHMSPKTVDTHRGHIKEKLGFRTTPEFLRYAIGWAAAQKRPAAGEDESASLATLLPDKPGVENRRRH
ncbi:MAG TPA: response regulator transcription factor [Alphaproteobacteria bacterium]|nr:response regulator transcription factor [Alphaproteobacteria bacterium]